MHHQFFQCVSLSELFDLGHHGHSSKWTPEVGLTSKVKIYEDWLPPLRNAKH